MILLFFRAGMPQAATSESGQNFQAAFPPGAARARFAGAAEDGVAEARIVQPNAAS
jgi:hypothetical protein